MSEVPDRTSWHKVLSVALLSWRKWFALIQFSSKLSRLWWTQLSTQLFRDVILLLMSCLLKLPVNSCDAIKLNRERIQLFKTKLLMILYFHQHCSTQKLKPHTKFWSSKLPQIILMNNTSFITEGFYWLCWFLAKITSRTFWRQELFHGTLADEYAYLLNYVIVGKFSVHLSVCVIRSKISFNWNLMQCTLAGKMHQLVVGLTDRY